MHIDRGRSRTTRTSGGRGGDGSSDGKGAVVTIVNDDANRW